MEFVSQILEKRKKISEYMLYTHFFTKKFELTSKMLIKMYKIHYNALAMFAGKCD